MNDPPDRARAREILEEIRAELRLLDSHPDARDSVVSRVGSLLDELTTIIADLDASQNARSPTSQPEIRVIAGRVMSEVAAKLIDAMW